jgi:hypothetical protein
VIAAGRRRSAGVARVVAARRWRLSRSARMVAAGRRWLVVMGRRRRLVTFRRWRWWWRRSRGNVAGAAGQRRRAVVDVVIRIERTADAFSGAVVGTRTFGIRRRQWRTREVAGVVRTITRRRGRRRLVIAHGKQVPLRELAPGIGGARRRTGRIRRVVGTQVRRERTSQRCGLDCQWGVIHAADPEREADDYGSYARGPCHDAQRIGGFR